MAKSNSVLLLAVGLIIALGYVLMLVSTLSSSGKTVQSELSALASQNDLLQKNMIEKEMQIKALKTEMEKAKEDSSKALKVVSSQQTASSADRPGVIILGMHRSGTSIVGGLMNMMGLKTGGPLILAAEDNAKGFFERIDVVLQNDYVMQKQQVHYAFNTYRFDHIQGLKEILLHYDEKFFNEGRRGLAFLNDEKNYPWMLKDPRLCITLRMWLPLLNFVPSILFTYRHPLDVALSLSKREFEHFRIGKGIRMWYVYNRRAVEQSNDLCRVVTSHRKVMKQPKVEFDRIYDELQGCGVLVPHRLTEAELGSFIDLKLQHGRTSLVDKSCEEDLSQIMPPATWPTTEHDHVKLYREAMRVYCAMEDGTAFKKGFVWDHDIRDD